MTSISLVPDILVKEHITIAKFFEYLADEGYQPIYAEADELVFNFLNGRYVFNHDESSPFYFSVTAFSIHALEQEGATHEAELDLCRDIAEKLTKDYRLAKVMVRRKRVDLSFELCASSMEDVTHWFSWVMEIAYAVITQFESMRQEAVSQLTTTTTRFITNDITSTDNVTPTLQGFTNIETPSLH